MDPCPFFEGDAEKYGGGVSVIDSERGFSGYRGSGHPIDRRSQSLIGGRFRSHAPEKSIPRVFAQSRSNSLGGGDSAASMQSESGLDNAANRGAADVQASSDLAVSSGS